MRHPVVLLALAAGCAPEGADSAPASATEPAPPAVAFHCAKDETCPELRVGGDPFATLGGEPAPFRGYGDPSLELDPASGTLWMAYSWLDLAVVEAGPPPQPDLRVRTHLARSRDGGATFELVRAVNEARRIDHPDTAEPGWLIHEVPSLARQPDGLWQALWLQYFDPVGPPERLDFQYVRAVAPSPAGLGDDAEPWLRTGLTTPSFGARTRLDDVPELADCTVLTEPALFANDGVLYLATSCLVFERRERRPERERLVLLRGDGPSHRYVGVLADAADAAALGGDVLTQADLSLGRDGSVILLVTPKRLDDDPQHQGCVALQVADLPAARIARDELGRPLRRAVITADGNGLGPGLCSYDAASETGVLLVITTFSSDPVSIEFSLRRTGIHP